MTLNQLKFQNNHVTTIKSTLKLKKKLSFEEAEKQYFVTEHTVSFKVGHVRNQQ